MSRALLFIVVWIVFLALVASVASLVRSDVLARPTLTTTPAQSVDSKLPSIANETLPIRNTAENSPSATDHAEGEIATTTAKAVTSAATTSALAVETMSAARSKTKVAFDASSASTTALVAAPLDTKALQDPPSSASPRRPKRGQDEDGGLGLGRLPPGVPPEYEGLGVTVVNRSTGKGAGNVRVRWATQPVLDEWAAQGHAIDREDPEDLLARSKDPLLTDAQGIAITPSAPGRMLVDARIGTQYGFAWADRNRGSQVRIELSEDRDLVVQTSDSNGAPMPGVTVVMRDSSCSDLWRGETSADDAKVKIRHAAFRIERDASPGDCWILAEGVMPSSSAIRVSRGKLPVSEVALTLVASARVVVHVVDVEGRPIANDVRVAVSSAGVTALCGRRVESIAKKGEAIFERVEVDREMSIEVEGHGVFEDVHVNAAGPKAGHDRTVDVRFARRWPVAQIVLVDAHDKPLAAQKCWGWFVRRAASGAQYEAFDAPIETDATGRARLAVHVPSTGGGPESVCLALRNTSGDWFSSATVALPQDWTSGERDLGTVKLVEMPTLAAGYVLDERNAAVVDAMVEISSFANDTKPLEMFVADRRWTARSDARGYFRLRGIVDGSALAIAAVAAGHVTAPRIAQKSGDAKTKLVLPRCSALVGRVLLPGRMPIEWVRVSIESDEEELPLRVADGGWFRCTTLQPGPFALGVYVEGLPEPVHYVDRVDVRAGVDVNDGRVSLIDLRNRLTFVTLFVLAAEGGAVEGGEIHILEHIGDDDRTRTMPITAGFVSYVTLDAAAKTEVVVPGFVTQTLEALTGDSEVHLERTKR